jgi:hypothetical protein
MNESAHGKILPSIVAKIISGNERDILDAIDRIRNSGNPEYLPYLMSLLIQSLPESIINEVLIILGELKDQKSVPFLLEAINNNEYTSVRKELIASCWQNGLDFSDHLPFFVDLVINNEFEIAFEAFTVIENLEFQPVEEVRQSEIKKIDDAIVTSKEININLLRALRSLLT